VVHQQPVDENLAATDPMQDDVTDALKDGLLRSPRYQYRDHNAITFTCAVGDWKASTELYSGTSLPHPCQSGGRESQGK